MLVKIADVDVGGNSYSVYKGGFVNIFDKEGIALYCLLENESLIVDQFLTTQVVSDEIAEDFINGTERKGGYKFHRGFNPNSK